ncbi:MAG TPA: hypothetical protein VME23_18455 [Terracidiphilus sp.]|nr:hypothetical protein [Terracidiphilus sp.]
MMNRTLIKELPRSTGLLAVVVAGVWFGALPQAFAAASAGPCVSNPDNRALDFWLGQWTIAAPGGSPSATSTVSLELDECVVVERWDGGRGHTGENLFAYSADDQSWHGMFADNEGRVHVFVDGKASPGLAFFNGPSRGPNGETILNRVTIRRIDANKVEQEWEKSSDGGRTWTIAFRGEYMRKRP